jgi:flagella synthesis protein FlgN
MTDLLTGEIGCLHDFLAAIAAEQSLLVAGQVEPLQAAADAKAGVAARLSRLDEQRGTQLKSLGFEASRGGMEAWLQTQPADASLQGQWKTLLELAAKAKLENDINGRLIGSRLQQNQQALSILLGGDSTPATYGPNGQQASIAGRRPIGSA